MDYHTAIHQWMQAQHNGSFSGMPLAKSTIRNNRLMVNDFFKYLKQNPSLQAITAENLHKVVFSFRVEKTKCYFATKINMKKAIKSFAKYLVQIGEKPESLLKQIDGIKIYRHAPVIRKKPTHKQTLAVLRSSKKLGLDRITALIALTGLCGLRIGEALELQVEHISIATATLFIIGKGNKIRRIPIPPEAIQWLLPWENVRQHPTRYLDRLSYKTANKYLKQLLKPIGINLSFHPFRRAAATTWAKNNMPLHIIRYALGHANITTTQLYIEADENDAFQWFYPEYGNDVAEKF